MVQGLPFQHHSAHAALVAHAFPSLLSARLKRVLYAEQPTSGEQAAVEEGRGRGISNLDVDDQRE